MSTRTPWPQLVVALLVASACARGGQGKTVASPSSARRGAPQVSATPDTSGPQPFRSWAMARLVELRPSWSVSPAEDPLTILVQIEEQRIELGVGRMWDYCARGARDCGARVEEYLEGALVQLDAALHPPALQASQLMPAVRSREQVEAYRARVPDLWVEALAADLFVVYMFDQPTAAKVASERDLATLGLDTESARQQAFAHARSDLGVPDDHVKPLTAGQLGVLPQHHYASSLLVPSSAWANAAKLFGGQLLVAAPANDVVFYADGRDPMALAALTAIAQDAFERAERGLSPTVLRFTEVGWEAASP